MSKILGAVWAQTENRIIGRDGDMPWFAPEDLAHFKEVTLGAPVIMGRKTWESFPSRFRPLPGRLNIVVTSSVSEPVERDGAWWVSDIPTAIEHALAKELSSETVWIIGGANIYEQAMALENIDGVSGGRLSLVERTVFTGEIRGDASAPDLGDEWTRTSVTEDIKSEQGYLLGDDQQKLPLVYRFESLQR